VNRLFNCIRDTLKCDDIEETTADRNEVQIRQLNQIETEEPCDAPSHLTDLLERSKKHLKVIFKFHCTLNCGHRRDSDSLI
jgi:hypothetical protein